MTLSRAGHAWRAPALFVPDRLHGWLTDPHSLTARIRARCRQFAVRPLMQGRARAWTDEADLIGVDRAHVRTREVLLYADGVPVVFAHSVVSMDDVRGVWRMFAGV
ncbi:MAG TPA: chorismate lyase, partial [Methyloversatilis sp.]